VNYEHLVTASDDELLSYLEGLNVTTTGIVNVLRNLLPRIAAAEAAARPSQDPAHWNQVQAPTPTTIIPLKYPTTDERAAEIVDANQPKRKQIRATKNAA